jgi:hypothetical protein
MYARKNRGMCQKTKHVHAHSDVCVIKKKRMRDESDDLVTNTNSNIRKHTYVLVQNARIHSNSDENVRKNNKYIESFTHVSRNTTRSKGSKRIRHNKTVE